jgi:hypothetical protein
MTKYEWVICKKRMEEAFKDGMEIGADYIQDDCHSGLMLSEETKEFEWQRYKKKYNKS